MIMFSNRRRPILDIAALKWVMREKQNFQDGVARFPLTLISWVIQKGFWESYMYAVIERKERAW